MTTESNSARIGSDAPQALRTASRPESGPFVINLCSSTTPMALRIPELPELKRFAFFVSRRREEGRERFRLHMGHFETLAEAEEWLGVVRDLYPGAWAGEAPGKKLRAAQEATAQAAVALAGATTDAPALRASPPQILPPAPRARPAPPPASAPPATQTPPRKAPANAGAANPSTGAAHRSHTTANTSNPAAGSMASWPPSSGGRPRRPERAGPAAHGRESPPPNTIPVVQAARLPPPAAGPGAPRPVASPEPPPVQQSNVRQVLAELDSTDDARPMPPSPPGSGRSGAPPRILAAGPPSPVAPAAGNPTADPADDPALSDTQVLRMLERRRDAAAKAPPPPVVGAPEDIQLLRPDDVSTMSELRQGLTANRQLFFAVQLEWSVQPIDLKRVPPLAIFSAYTLYTVEGNREGRKWYGLRVGFFADSISAKQVALYVRSEFKAVAVIPVSGREKTRATEDGRLSQSALGQAHHQEKPEEEFKLIDETGERPAPALQKPGRPPDAASRSVAPAKPASTGPAPKAKPAARPTPRTDRGRRVPESRKRSREKTVEETLEETLEILGASQLSLDDGRTPFINDTGVRHTSVTVDNNTGTFAKLLDRLSDRLIRGR